MFYLIEIISKLLALPSEALAKEGCWCAAQGSGLRAQSTGQLPTSCLYAFTPSCLHAFPPANCFLIIWPISYTAR